MYNPSVGSIQEGEICHRSGLFTFSPGILHIKRMFSVSREPNCKTFLKCDSLSPKSNIFGGSLFAEGSKLPSAEVSFPFIQSTTKMTPRRKLIKMLYWEGLA